MIFVRRRTTRRKKKRSMSWRTKNKRKDGGRKSCREKASKAPRMEYAVAMSRTSMSAGLQDLHHQVRPFIHKLRYDIGQKRSCVLFKTLSLFCFSFYSTGGKSDNRKALQTIFDLQRPWQSGRSPYISAQIEDTKMMDRKVFIHLLIYRGSVPPPYMVTLTPIFLFSCRAPSTASDGFLFFIPLWLHYDNGPWKGKVHSYLKKHAPHLLRVFICGEKAPLDKSKKSSTARCLNIPPWWEGEREMEPDIKALKLHKCWKRRQPPNDTIIAAKREYDEYDKELKEILGLEEMDEEEPKRSMKGKKRKHEGEEARV